MICPELAIRSTFIVGFPGETDKDFEFLLDWFREARLARVGCFKYEDVDGAKANALPGQVPEEVKAERHARLMQHQQSISTELLAARIGKTIEVIVDEVDGAGRHRALGLGRARDRRQCLSQRRDEARASATEFSRSIEASDEYDLWASLAAPATAPRDQSRLAPRRSNASLRLTREIPSPVYPPLSALLKHVCRFAHQAAYGRDAKGGPA